MKIIFVTGNKMKIKACNKFFENTDIKIIGNDLDVPEIQSDNVKEVAIEEAKYAYDKIKEPLIINDCGLVIPALNGFPGPYAKYAEKTIKEDGFLKLMIDKENREAYYLDVLVYIDGEIIKTFECKTEGTISLIKEGNNGNGYDKIFIPKGMKKPLACYSNDQILKVWMNTTYNDFYGYIKNKGK